MSLWDLLSKDIQNVINEFVYVRCSECKTFDWDDEFDECTSCNKKKLCGDCELEGYTQSGGDIETETICPPCSDRWYNQCDWCGNFWLDDTRSIGQLNGTYKDCCFECLSQDMFLTIKSRDEDDQELYEYQTYLGEQEKSCRDCNKSCEVMYMVMNRDREITSDEDDEPPKKKQKLMNDSEFYYYCQDCVTLGSEYCLCDRCWNDGVFGMN